MSTGYAVENAEAIAPEKGFKQIEREFLSFLPALSLGSLEGRFPAWRDVDSAPQKLLVVRLVKMST